MKKLFFISIGILTLTACTEFISKPDMDGEWELSEMGPVKLYFKASGASSAPSPVYDQVQFMLENQVIYYHAIQDSINRSFNEPVLIYLYNKDQAEEIIGTSGGGLSQPRFLTIYYTFIFDIRPYTDQYGIENPYLGAHELVHIITHNVLGHPGTKMMSEGYAVWLSGGYGRSHIDDILGYYKYEEPEKMMNPDQLLFEAIDNESIYYPNAGVFIRHLVKNFGIETINSLFSIEKDEFIKEFEKLTGKLWEEMEAEYELYLENI